MKRVLSHPHARRVLDCDRADLISVIGLPVRLADAQGTDTTLAGLLRRALIRAKMQRATA